MPDTSIPQPIPVDRLVQQVCDDGSDYDDGVFGYCSGTFDPDTQVLTLKFERDDDYASAEYRFRLISGFRDDSSWVIDSLSPKVATQMRELSRIVMRPVVDATRPLLAAAIQDQGDEVLMPDEASYTAGVGVDAVEQGALGIASGTGRLGLKLTMDQARYIANAVLFRAAPALRAHFAADSDSQDQGDTPDGGMWVDRDGDLWCFDDTGSWVFHRTRPADGWHRGPVVASGAEHRYGPLVEVPALPGSATAEITRLREENTRLQRQVDAIREAFTPVWDLTLRNVQASITAIRPVLEAAGIDVPRWEIREADK